MYCIRRQFTTCLYLIRISLTDETLQNQTSCETDTISVHFQVINRFLDDGTELDESHSWFDTPKVIAEMGKTLNAFTEFASVNKKGKCGFLFKTSRVSKQMVNVFAQKGMFFH